MADNHGSTVGEPNNKNKWKLPLLVFFEDPRQVFKFDSLGRELLGIAVPAALAVAADPIASLIDTAFIGHLGPVELAAAGISITLFNQASRITIFPLVSITTSFVAEEDTLKKITGTKIVEEEAVVVDEDDHVFPDIEKGSPKQNHNGTAESCVGNSSFGNIEIKDSLPKTSARENAEIDTCLQNVNLGNDINTNTSKSSSTASSKMSTEENSNKNIINTNTSNSSSSSAAGSSKNKSKKKKKQIASATTALIFGTILGLIQALILIFAAKPLLRAMGAKPGSPMLIMAEKYLKLRSLGAPAVLLALAMQGIFRGFKDTTTPLYVIVIGYAINVALDPILIFRFKLGLKGAAIAHVISQYLMALTLLLMLMRKVYLLPPSIKDLQIFRFLKNGGLLLTRVIAVTFCVTFAASLAARLGPIPMAAFQTCQQVWITSSLLADGLAVAIQAVLACSFAEKDYGKAKAASVRVLQMTFVMGVGLSLIVGIGLYFGAGVFSKTLSVLHLIRIGLPFVAATQPINSLAFVFDGVNYGASDFTYAATSLVLVSIVSVGIEFVMYKIKGFVGIWIALSIYMVLRMLAGIWRMGTGTGPWRFLRG